MAFSHAKPVSGKRILVIDDDQVMLATLSMVLRRGGYEVATAASGSEAIRTLQEFEPDLILLDLEFPPDSLNVSSALEDGFTIISWLRTLGGAVITPIVVISGADLEENHHRSEAAGVVAFFQKPVDHDRLLDFIYTTFNGRGQSLD